MNVDACVRQEAAAISGSILSLMQRAWKTIETYCQPKRWQ